MAAVVRVAIVSVFASTPARLLAPIATEKEPSAVGVPEMTPVDGSNDAQAGKPVALKVMDAVPVAVSV